MPRSAEFNNQEFTSQRIRGTRTYSYIQYNRGGMQRIQRLNDLIVLCTYVRCCHAELWSRQMVTKRERESEGWSRLGPVIGAHDQLSLTHMTTCLAALPSIRYKLISYAHVLFSPFPSQTQIYSVLSRGMEMGCVFFGLKRFLIKKILLN
jgi:hypothetical protein